MTDKEALEFDPIWEELYANGQHLNRYPFNNVPNFFFTYLPRDKPLAEVKVLEVGFGAGNNLWMCAREGVYVAGVDAAPSGVEFANKRFEEDGLSGDLRVGDFTDLPFADCEFDLAINRQAITQVGHSRAITAVEEVRRCLKPGGVFWSNMFSDRSHRKGKDIGDGLWTSIEEGKLVDVGQTAFHSKEDMLKMYTDDWEFLDLQHIETTKHFGDDLVPYCEWYATTRKRK